MCRLFGLHAGTTITDATFWLLDAPDSLTLQSHRNQDGFGIGAFTADGTARVDKAPRPAWEGTAFDTDAHSFVGTTFVAHVRRASTGSPTWANTHPFEQDARLFAHNGALGDLPTLDRHLDALGVRHLVEGDTDSERFFALITAEIERRGGDVDGGIGAAVRWITRHLPVVSLNFVLTTATDLWAFRQPALDTLFVLERTGQDAGRRELEVRGSQLAARSSALVEHDSVIVASERLDGEDGWREVDPGALVHVGPELRLTQSSPLGG